MSNKTMISVNILSGSMCMYVGAGVQKGVKNSNTSYCSFYLLVSLDAYKYQCLDG